MEENSIETKEAILEDYDKHAGIIKDQNGR